MFQVILSLIFKQIYNGHIKLMHWSSKYLKECLISTLTLLDGSPYHIETSLGLVSIW